MNSGSVLLLPILQRQKPGLLSGLSKVTGQRRGEEKGPGFCLRPGAAQSRADGFVMTPSEAGPARRRPGEAGMRVPGGKKHRGKWNAVKQTARVAAWAVQAGPGRPRVEGPSAEARPSRTWRLAPRRGLTCLWSLLASPSAMWPWERPGGHCLLKSGARGRGAAARAKSRLQRGRTRNRNLGCATQPASASGLRARW